MPIFMDRHNIPRQVTAEHVAEMHKLDLEIEHLYNCRGITYWCDEKKGNAFCLIEAPNKESIQKMHDHAHGEFPADIIEVDEKLIASFLGRIDDPENLSGNDLNIIDDSAFRVIMVIETNNYLNRIEANQLSVFTQKLHKSVLKSIKKFKGSVVKQDNCSYLVSFTSISDAISCALKIQSNINYITPKFDGYHRLLNIAIGSGDPVTDKDTIFEDVISLATRMCEVVDGKIVISSQVKNLFVIENRNLELDSNLVRPLNPVEEKFLTQLMNYMEKVWSDPNIKTEHLSSELGYSKSQLYRKLKSLTNKSPNNFIKEMKLNKSLNLFHNKLGNVSEIAFEVGFNSPAYFTKCFYEKFGILPSKYTQQHIF
ncbi:MAG: histidine kinase [Lutibacter sp.]|nr:MAG: histidine kinase [Lutibacter sp.]